MERGGGGEEPNKTMGSGEEEKAEKNQVIIMMVLPPRHNLPDQDRQSIFSMDSTPPVTVLYQRSHVMLCMHRLTLA